MSQPPTNQEIVRLLEAVLDRLAELERAVERLGRAT
jgi:hypothetical protein